MARITIESVSAQPRIKLFGNNLLVDLNEFRIKGFSVNNVHWDAADGTMIVNFQYEGTPNGVQLVNPEGPDGKEVEP